MRLMPPMIPALNFHTAFLLLHKQLLFGAVLLQVVSFDHIVNPAEAAFVNKNLLFFLLCCRWGVFVLAKPVLDAYNSLICDYNDFN